MSITTLTLWESVVLDDLPAAYWGLDTADPTVDDSGSGNTLTAVAAPANNATLLPAGETGGATGARDFNGSTQAYTAADSVFLDLADAFTLELVVQFDSVAGSDTLISKGTGAYQLRRNGTTLELLKEGTGVILATTGITLATATTYHVVACKHGADGAWIYVNGTDRSGTVTDRTCTDTATSLHLARKSDSTEYTDGRLDEVALYAYAFTADMVTTHYEAMSAGTFGEQIGGSGASTRLPRAKVEIAFESNPRDTYQRWADVTSYCRAWSGSRGRNVELERTEAARGMLVLSNRGREFDDTYTGSPFYPNVKPTRAVRVRAQINTSQTYPRLWGYTEGHPIRRPMSGKDSFVEIQVIGPFKGLALDKIVDPTPRPEELSGARLEEVIGAVSGLRYEGDAGQSLIVSGDLDQANRLEHALTVTETEGGILFEAGDGVLTFQDRHYRILNEASVRAIYGDGGGSEIPVTLLEPQTDEARLYTAAAVTPASGLVQTAEDTAASDMFFKRTKDVSTLHAVDTDAAAMANMYANRYSTPRSRIQALAPVPQNRPANAEADWKTVLGHELSHRIQSKERPIGDTSVVAREHFIEQITDQVTPGGWRVSFSVSPAELDSTYAIVGTAVVGDEAGSDNAIIGW